MDAEKDILEVWKERILTESKRGDRMKACKNIDVSYTTHQNAMKKATLIDLTDAEMDVLAENIKILDERKEKQLQYATN